MDAQAHLIYLGIILYELLCPAQVVIQFTCHIYLTFSDTFSLNTVLLGPRHSKRCLRTSAKCTYSNIPHACAKCHLGVISLLIHAIVYINSVSGRRRLWSDCADAQADLGLRCPHMPKDTFLHGAAHLMMCLKLATNLYTFCYGLSVRMLRVNTVKLKLANCKCSVYIENLQHTLFQRKATHCFQTLTFLSTSKTTWHMEYTCL